MRVEIKTEVDEWDEALRAPATGIMLEAFLARLRRQEKTPTVAVASTHRWTVSLSADSVIG